MSPKIRPQILKGFRDSLPHGPQGEKRRRHIIEKLAGLFELAGFEPIDTPALELSEILLGKAGGETEKQIYRFTDNGGRDVALRFDLTVPFSRFVVQHAAELNFPFKRYHIAKVWRGENAQRGRYREFYQCDFDIVGDSSVLADLQILQVAHHALSRLQQSFPALGGLRIHVNHRGLLGAFWDSCDIAKELRPSALRIIDKAHKLAPEHLEKELGELLGAKTAKLLSEYLDLKNEEAQKDFPTELSRIANVLGGSNEALQALEDLRRIWNSAVQLGIKLHFDPSIARGLDYYTGMVFECFLEDLPGLGSICSGGRYDQLTQLYSAAPLPGVGGSIGLDRLLAGLEELEKSGSTAVIEQRVLLSLDPQKQVGQVEQDEEKALMACLALSAKLQEQGIACDLVPRVKKMAALFARAEHSRYLLLLQADSLWHLRDLKTREKLGSFADADELLQKFSAMRPKTDCSTHR